MLCAALEPGLCCLLRAAQEHPAGICSQDVNWSQGDSSAELQIHEINIKQENEGLQWLQTFRPLLKTLHNVFWNTKPFNFCSKFSNPVYLLCRGNNQKLPDWDLPNSCWQLPSSLARLVLARNNWISYLLLHNCNKKPQHPTLKGGGGQGKVHNWRDNPCLAHVVTSIMWFLLQ